MPQPQGLPEELLSIKFCCNYPLASEPLTASLHESLRAILGVERCTLIDTVHSQYCSPCANPIPYNPLYSPTEQGTCHSLFPRTTVVTTTHIANTKTEVPRRHRLRDGQRQGERVESKPETRQNVHSRTTR